MAEKDKNPILSEEQHKAQRQKALEIAKGLTEANPDNDDYKQLYLVMRDVVEAEGLLPPESLPPVDE